jgi:hypothetical protein
MPTKQTFTAGQVLTAAQLNTLQDYVGVVQVKSTTLTSTFSTTSTSFTDLTGLSVSITPTSATNKILALVSINCGSDNIAICFRLMRDSTAIAVGDAAGVRTRSTSANLFLNNVDISPINMNFLDSPATTSATTYKVQLLTNASTAYINRTTLDNDATTRPRMVSTITVMEVTP